jgi:hypothetical protein
VRAVVPVDVLRPEIALVERLMVGVPGTSTAKSAALVAVSCPTTSTVIFPVVASFGTVAVICVPAPFTELAAAKPLNRTAGVAPKLKPFIVTVSPAKPEAGVNEVIKGPVLVGSPVRDMLSRPIPDEPPVSVPRQIAQRICTTGWLSAAAGKVAETVVLSPVVPPACENGFEPEEVVIVDHVPLVPTRYCATTPTVRGCALMTLIS